MMTSKIPCILAALCILQCIRIGLTFNFYKKNLEEKPRYIATPDDSSSLDRDLTYRNRLLNLIKRNLLTDEEHSWPHLPYPGPSFHRRFGGRRFGVNTGTQSSRENLWTRRSRLPHARNSEDVKKRDERRNSGLYVTDDESENGMIPYVNAGPVRKRMHTCPFFFRSGWPLGACYTPTFFQPPVTAPPPPTQPPTHNSNSLLRRHAYQQLNLRWPIMHMMGGGLGKRSIETPNGVAFRQSQKVKRSADMARNSLSEIPRVHDGVEILDDKTESRMDSEELDKDESVDMNMRFSNKMDNLSPVHQANTPMSKEESDLAAITGTELALQPSASLEQSDSSLITERGSTANFKKSAWYPPHPTYYWPSMFMLGGGLGKRAELTSGGGHEFQASRSSGVVNLA